MLLAGDVGGTKTLLGLFERGDPRPRPIVSRAYPTTDYPSFTAILDAFARDAAQPFVVEAAAVGVAGPVIHDRASLTNIPWDISCAEITARFETPRVRLLNDLAAMASSVVVLAPDELVVLQEGTVHAAGHAAVIAAGTGLGAAYLHRVNGRLRPAPSETGHADFAARTDEEIELLRALRARFGRVEIEDVLSGPGIANLHGYTHGDGPCDATAGLPPDEIPAAVTGAGLARTCPRCERALSLFVTIYGAESGNVALRGVTTAGIYVGGGIAPKILPALQDGSFIAAFRAKGIMTELVSRIPVKVILNADAGLLGAAVAAQEL
jgi:glucokinase